MRARCRLGFHRWTRVKVDDPTLESSDNQWETLCRDCGKERRALLPRIGMGTGQ